MRLEPLDCTVVQSSGSSVLDTATCKLLTVRAGFKPARNEAGQAVASHYADTMNWKMPGGPPGPGYRVTITQVGNQMTCRLDDPKTPPLRQETCSAIKAVIAKRGLDPPQRIMIFPGR